MSLFHLQHKLGRIIKRGNKEFLFFSGTDYLGLGSSFEFEDLVIEGIQKLGMNHGLSRINNVRFDIYDQFEGYFAEKAGAEKALLWSSGYLAGYATLNYLLDNTDYIFMAPDTHPAILPDELTPDSSQSFKEWAAYVQETSETLKAQRVLILGNAVDPLKPAIHDYSWIGNLSRKHQYTFLLDDSHAFGTVGENPFGTYNRWKFLPVELLVSGSLGKGLGIPAGITLGPITPIIGMANRRIFRSSSPPPQGYIWAFLQAETILREKFEKLHKNLHYFNSLIRTFDTIESHLGFPVYSFEQRKWVSQLEEDGIIVSSFPYPEPTDPWSNRIVITASHEEQDLNRLYEALKKIQSPVNLG
ncbi:aminotransferase class I/II-fold pyridoxal phosphate-dependent enzyme [Cecembia calidifontis]|uniref:7-keto-8-aminopelargonate synthetase-like enzyme n=1 Tax=Cecembia calidifontis TaxID=1187080 RepID=A0A4Q7P6F1_9BACT|nr:aminotransferase class I/II-fold pyridoxal phosphate-dependent enzyme [Cecembia calidifontis]RZS95088.1 7-keto-8-aminopelargonate synthetase-like enzyme [Cecembia calidifontis]